MGYDRDGGIALHGTYAGDAGFWMTSPRSLGSISSNQTWGAFQSTIKANMAGLKMAEYFAAGSAYVSSAEIEGLAYAAYRTAGVGVVNTMNRGRVFWSGGEVAKSSAMNFAKSNGMQTLEMTIRGRIMNTITPYLPRSISGPIWNNLSEGFAKKAIGEAHFFTTPLGPRPTSIWLNVEKPILLRNGVSIITH